MFLNCHTAYSFKYGTLAAEELIREAIRCKVKKLALTEINNTASYIEVLRLLREYPDGPEIVLGMEFRREHEFLYLAIARNNNGFQRINRFRSYHNLEVKPLPRRAPELEDTFVIYPFRKIEPEELKQNEYIGIGLHELNYLPLYAPLRDFPDKFVILHPVTFASRTQFNLHRLLRAIDLNTLLSKLPATAQARPEEKMMPETELRQHFRQWPQLISNTESLLAQCTHTIELGVDKNLKTVTGQPETDWDFLVTQAWQGFCERYDPADPVLRERLDRELNVIRARNFCAYYLIAHDLVSFAKKNNYDYVGRGSGANSVVAYCLGITNVDPIELNLYFERFLNEERSSPPDFDIDFSWDNRDAIYDYLFSRYGREHVCLLATHVTYQDRSVIRELGKVFGLPKAEIDRLAEDPEKHNRDHITELIIRYAALLKDLPANLSIHAGGVLITQEPIYAWSAVDLPPKGYPVSHFEMHNAEDLGIYKFDILSQRGLGHLKETVRHVKRNRNIDVNIHRFHDFKKDEKVRELLRTSKAIGCFYVESPAMRGLLAKLRCEDYLSLVAASSIIRPGVARSGMMRTYIERFHAVRNGGTYECIHPLMDDLLRETYGVMVYQEDVIKIAHHFAGLSLTESDVLRRGMSGKYRSRSEFKRVEQRFFENCRTRGYDPAVVDRVWYEIESFSGYSFAKGHSASYAVESYQSLYLKAHYPIEFMVGVINNFGGFYKTEFYFHEARLSGATIEAPCVNHSEYLTTVEATTIYIGFIHLKSLTSGLGETITRERTLNGPYRSLDNFLRRVSASLEQIRILIRVGAFRFTTKDKQRLLWEAMLWFSETKVRKPVAALFESEPYEYPLPPLDRSPIDDAYDEIELIGFPLCDPFSLLLSPERGNTVARELPSRLGRIVEMIGYLVTTKTTGTRDGRIMYFGTFYDWEGCVFDSVHFPDIATRDPFRGRGFYKLVARVTEDFGVHALEVHSMKKLALKQRKI